MRPEQVPGSLFVLLAALAAFSLDEPGALLALALGCALGWWGMSEDVRGIRVFCLFAALGVWALAFIYLSWKVLL